MLYAPGSGCSVADFDGTEVEARRRIQAESEEVADDAAHRDGKGV